MAKKGNPRRRAVCTKCGKNKPHYTRKVRRKSGIAYRLVRPCCECAIERDAERYERMREDPDALEEHRDNNREAQRRRRERLRSSDESLEDVYDQP